MHLTTREYSVTPLCGSKRARHAKLSKTEREHLENIKDAGVCQRCQAIAAKS